jgi:hypothetical protein
VAVVLTVLLGAPTSTVFPARSAPGNVAWEQFVHIPAVLDVAGPRSDGRLVVAAHGRLFLMDAAGRTSDFAPAYSVPDGPEPYIVLSPGVNVEAAGCAFERDDVFALDLHDPSPGVTRIAADGTVSHLADVAGVTTLLGIALDTGGAFGHRLLVIGPTQSGKTQVAAVDCRGTVTAIGAVDTPLEGGIAVAPSSFGRFSGQLIATDEKSGTIFAVSPNGELSTVAASGAPAGPDIGVESAGFVPAAGADAAFLADRGGQADPHSGTDSVLRLTGDALSSAGVRPGDLLVGTEGGGTVVQVRCAPDCVASVVATGPPTAHTEGRLLVVNRPEFRGSPAAAPLPSSSPTASSSSSSSGGSKGRGPLIAIGIAALAAVGVGVFVRRRGRRVS